MSIVNGRHYLINIYGVGVMVLKYLKKIIVQSQIFIGPTQLIFL